MYSRAKVGRHPIHTMLVGFPITFYVLTVVGFVAYKFFSADVFWYKLGFFSNYAAVVTAVLAAIPGTIDLFTGIPRHSEARRTGLIHMLLNVMVLGLFLVNAILISGTWSTAVVPTGTNIFLTILGVCGVAVGAYFGWELVSRHKVGIELTPAQERIEEIREMGNDADEPVIFH